MGGHDRQESVVTMGQNTHVLLGACTTLLAEVSPTVALLASTLAQGRKGVLVPTQRTLAFLYWRVTWQGCTNLHLLHRSHGLPFYGIAEWRAAQPVTEFEETDLSAFQEAKDAS